ncbi:MAG: NAD(P)H-dependent oxidoreductase subunit E [Peptococcaceae bacterium]|jgi:NADH:ubiquinone oxidoreductase subunit E|nr:NAD(P)H-dependent oxidoreductase subunit E [Peptococcaceae bacterium]
MECQCQTAVEKGEQFLAVDRIVKQVGNDKSNLIQVLEKVQHELGYLPEEVQSYVAKKMSVPLSEVFGVVTFYALFNVEPVGKYKISVCLGTACYVKGSGKIIEEFQRQLGVKSGETTEDGVFTLEACRCLGACGLAPVLNVNGKVFGKLTPEDVGGIIAQYKDAV